MKNETKLKLLLMLILYGTPCVAQPESDLKKQEMRAQNFADFLLYWTEWSAYMAVNRFDIKRAERRDYDKAIQQIPEMVQDSTYYANEIVKSANIINTRYPLNAKPDMPYFMYEIIDCYKNNISDKNSNEYKLGCNISKYEKVLKKLKLARYTVQVNQK